MVDIRDPRELEREGTVPGALLAPRGMLEFWVDPASPYFKPAFGDESKEFVLFCGAGWRSALAAKALQDMGMTNVAHIDGGFGAWLKAEAPHRNPGRPQGCPRRAQTRRGMSASPAAPCPCGRATPRSGAQQPAAAATSITTRPRPMPSG